MSPEIILFLVLHLSTSAFGSHFRGGLFAMHTTEDMKKENDGTKVIFNFRLGWRRGVAFCDDTTIASKSLIGPGSVVYCRLGCRKGDTYVSSLTNTQFYCTDFSIDEDWTVGERSVPVTIPMTSTFAASFASAAWISLRRGGGSWEMRIQFNTTKILTVRGHNASPQTKMAPILRLQRGCNHTVTIPVEDSDRDEVRCRWAESSKGECGGVCKTFSEAKLDGRKCILNIQLPDTVSTGYYAVALQIEDFADTTDIYPLSSIPLQFLANVFDSSGSCYSKPEFIFPTPHDGSCLGVLFNQTFILELVARVGNPEIEITGIQTQSPPGMYKSTMVKRGSISWFVNVTWVPQPSQFGPSIFCFSATDSAKLSSDQRCVTLLAGVSPPAPQKDKMSPISSVYPDNKQWELEFDADIFRPKRSSFIRFRNDQNKDEYIIDIATSSSIVFPDPGTLSKLVVKTNFRLTEKKTYHIAFDGGAVVGKQFCGPESRPVTSNDFWSFNVKDVTPPSITYINKPVYSNSTVMISWEFDEPVTVSCTLDTPDGMTPISCNTSYHGNFLKQGYHTLYIQAADEAKNSKQYNVQWYVDLTPPTVRIFNQPGKMSNKHYWQFFLTCYDMSPCSFNCRLNSNSSRPCSYRYGVQLQTHGKQKISVYATDSVGNTGPDATFEWIADFSPPVINIVHSISKVCGSSLKPEDIGFPTVTDDYDPKPVLKHSDKPSENCEIKRSWTAVDDATNKVTATQTISITNPIAPIVHEEKEKYIPCGSTNQLQNKLNVTSLCGRKLNITFVDSTPMTRCGISITREWTITDDCGKTTIFRQIIRVLDQTDPIKPKNGQINCPLSQNLEWPQFPYASKYQVYIWREDTDEPKEPTSVIMSRWYRDDSLFLPNMKYFWKIIYIVVVDKNTTNYVPSPNWGYKTKPFADLKVVGFDIPKTAFSGSTIKVTWTVKNIGNSSTIGSSTQWSDGIYISKSMNARDAIMVKSIPIKNILDQNDGYVQDTSIQVSVKDIGSFYIFVRTDIYHQINDYDFENNILRASVALQIKLSPPPNLVLKSAFVVGSSFSGKTTSVYWVVKNIGIGITLATKWYDSIYFSNDDKLDKNDKQLIHVFHEGALISDGEYSSSAKALIPNAIFGDFFLIIVTDSGNHVYEHFDEGDNLKTLPIKVTLSPTPDLTLNFQYLMIQPLSLKTEDTIKVKYSVKNAGPGTPFENWWYDTFTFKSIKTGFVYSKQSQFIYETKFRPTFIYVREFQYKIPPQLESGDYNITLTTDEGGNVFEYKSDDNNKATKVVKLEQTLPDLCVKVGYVSIEEEPTANIMFYNITIENKGKGKIMQTSWIDEISMFQTRTSKRYSIMSVRQKKYLPAGESYQISGKVILNENMFGVYKASITLNVKNSVFENRDCSNVFDLGNTEVRKRRFNIKVSDLEVSKSLVEAGTTISIKWKVQNIGQLSLTSDWQEVISLIQPNNSLPYLTLKKLPGQNPIPLNNSALLRNIDIAIPLSVVGEYSIFIGCEFGKEATDTCEPRQSSYVTVVAPPSPDLFISNVEVEYSEVEDGSQLLTVNTFIQNIGNSMQSKQSWKNKVSLSKSKGILSSVDRNLYSIVTLNQQMLAGDSITVTHILTLKGSVKGYYDVITELDIENQLTEINGKNNNIWKSKSPTLIKGIPPPTLTVTSHLTNHSNTWLTGQIIHIPYKVECSAYCRTDTSAWYDGLYAISSPNSEKTVIQVTSTGLRIGSVLHTMEHSTGIKYDSSFDINVPFGLNSNYSLYIILDVNNVLEIPRTSFAFNLPKMVSVVPGPMPDLVAILDSKPVGTIVSGDLNIIYYSVINNGKAKTSAMWYDNLYLSTDPALDPFDTPLKSSARVKDINNGKFYNNTIEYFLPYDLSSTQYYLLLVVNVDRRVFENDYQNNIISLIISVKNAPSVDIKTHSVTHSQSKVVYNQNIQYSYKVSNEGNLPAKGYLCDSVYLSIDKKWDITDVKVSGPSCGQFDLESQHKKPGNTKSSTWSGLVPKIKEGMYTPIVKTRTSARDLNLTNNIGISNTVMTVNPPEIRLNERKTIRISSNSNIVYKIPNIEEGIALLVNLFTMSSKAYHQMYMRKGGPPTMYRYDSTSNDWRISSQHVLVPLTLRGNYYLLVESTSVFKSSSYDIIVEVKEAKFDVTSIYPLTISPTGNATLKINGMLFPTKIKVCLLYQNSEKICALDVYRFNSALVYATFKVEGISIGKYSIKLEALDGRTAQNQELIEITSVLPGSLHFAISKPPPIRIGEKSKFQVSISNVGYSDVETPILSVYTGGKTKVQRVDSDPVVKVETEYTFLPMINNEPGVMIPPRTTRIFEFMWIPPPDFTGRELMYLTDITNAFLDKFLLESYSITRPNYLDEATWKIIWNNFRICTGNDAISFAQRIRAIGNAIKGGSTTSFSLPYYITNLLLIADGDLSPKRIFEVMDIQNSNSMSFLKLTFQRSYPASISQRRSTGPLGQGWILHLLEIRLILNQTDITLFKERKYYRFVKISSGKYASDVLSSDEIVEKQNSYWHYSSDTIYQYNDKGNLTKIQNRNDNTESITFKLDSKRRPSELHQSNGQMMTLQYNAIDKIITVELNDKNGLRISKMLLSYNTNGQLKSILKGENSVQYRYNDNGYLIEILHENEDKQIIVYDDQHRLKSVELTTADNITLGKVVTDTDCNGLMKINVSPGDFKSITQFGIGGTVIKVIPMLGFPQSFITNPQTKTRDVLSGDEVISSTSFDDKSDIITYIRANGDQLNAKLDKNGTLMELFDVIGSISKFSHSSIQRTVTFIDNSTEISNYDSNDRIAEQIQRDQSKITYEYSEKNQVMKKTTVSDVFHYEYNNEDKLTGIRNSEGKTSLIYGTKGFPLSISYPNGIKLSYTFNKYGQRTSLSSNIGYDIKYVYDKERKLQQLQNNKGDFLVKFEYDNRNRLIRNSFQNQLTTEYTYDSGSLRLKEVKNLDKNKALLSKFVYKYSGKGYRIETETKDGTWKYKYDNAGQLVSWESGPGTKESISYDTRQNRIERKSEGRPDQSYLVNELNQYQKYGKYKSFVHDKNGNLVQQVETRGSSEISERYVFDQDKHMTQYLSSKVICNMKYDVFGGLSEKECTDGEKIKYISDPLGFFGNDAIMVQVNGTWTFHYHAFAYGLVASQSQGNIKFYMFDGDGSVIHTSDSSGNILAHYAYDPFGVLIQGKDNDELFTFMGQYGIMKFLPSNNNLFLVRARIYDAQLGRFLSTDPIGYTGSPYNLYCYAENNPLANKDPQGKFVIFIIPLAVIRFVAFKAAIGAAKGAYGGAVNYVIEQLYFKFEPLNLGDFVGAAVSGAITGIGDEFKVKGKIKASVQSGAAYTGSLVSDLVNIRQLDFKKANEAALKAAATMELEAYQKMYLNIYFNILQKFFDWFRELKYDAVTACEVPVSRDPNDIIGPAGYGEAKFVADSHVMDYRIRFENDANATAPAQKVFISCVLDSDLDLATFKLGSIGFGDFELLLDYKAPFYQDTLAIPDLGLHVYFQAGLDIVNGEATWLFQTIDSKTGFPPSDPRVGFLPPNNGTTGQGYVMFKMNMKDTVKQGAKIDAEAKIFFDANAPIDTPPIFNTIDRVHPNTSLSHNVTARSDGGLLIHIVGQDQGSGVMFSNIYSLSDTGVATPILSGIQDNFFVLPWQGSKDTRVVLSATDNVGNTQPIDVNSAVSFDMSLECHNNCSRNGKCENGSCICNPNYFGVDCSKNSTFIDPPILQISQASSIEGKPFSIYISARAPGNQNASNLQILIKANIPNVYFSKGMETNNYQVLENDDFGSVIVTPPKYFSGILILHLKAEMVIARKKSDRRSSVAITVTPAANEPLLKAETKCNKDNGTPLVYIDANLVDKDGSEILKIILSGLPQSVNVTAGRRLTESSFKVENGYHELAVHGTLDSFSFNVSAIATEQTSGDIAEKRIQLDAKKCIINKTPSGCKTLEHSKVMLILLFFVSSFLTKSHN